VRCSVPPIISLIRCTYSRTREPPRAGLESSDAPEINAETDRKRVAYAHCADRANIARGDLNSRRPGHDLYDRVLYPAGTKQNTICVPQ